MTAGTAARRIRVVVGELGPDRPDDRSAGIAARVLRDAGHEVVYTGQRQAPEQTVASAIQEDADLIGLSVHPGVQPALVRRLLELLAERDASDIVVVGVGTLSAEDVSLLEEIGVATVFSPDLPATEITRWVAEHVAG